MTVSAHSGGGGRGIPWRFVGWGSAAFLLLLPLVANAPWTLSDFIFAGVMFALVGGILELAVWKTGNWSYRGAVAVAVAAGFLHVWITGAVGIIGSEDNPGNLLYLGVVVVATLGSILALGRPAGMAWSMAVTAVAEVLAPVIAYAGVADPRNDVLLLEVFGSAILFTGMWLLSARLFHEAAREQRSSGGS